MPYSLTLPDGTVVNNIPDNVTRAQALDNLKIKVPDAFPPPPGIGEQLLGLPGEIGKGFIRGLTVDPASGIASLGYTGARAAGADMVPFEQTGVGQALGRAQTALAPSDEGLITQFGGGLGSLLSFIPGGLLKGGIGLAAKLTQAGGVGSEEARARAEEARVLGDADATAGQQFVTQLGGTGIGFSELASLKFLTAPIEQILRGVTKSQADLIAPTLFNTGQRMLITGGIEGFQEGMANIAQDLIAKGIYNPNLEVGESALGDAAMGASVGAFAQGAIELATRGKRRQLYEQVKEQEELAKQAEEQRIAAEQQVALAAQERQKQQQAMQALGAGPLIDPETGRPILLLGGPAPEVNLQDPLGVRFGTEDLGPKVVSGLNRARKEKGLPPTQQFTIEDLVEAGSEKDAPLVSEMLARKIGYDPSVQISPQSIFDLALSKNIDVEARGFADFLRRTTGSPDVANMTAPQLFAAQQSLSALPNFTEQTQLPTGSQATTFDDNTYKKTVDGLKRTVLNSGPLGRSQVIEEIKGFSGLTETRDAERLLDTALRRGDLGASPTRGTQGTSINISLPTLPGIGGPDVRRGDYMDSEVTGYEVFSDDGKFKQTRPTMTAAENLAATAEQSRLNTVTKLTDEANRTQLVLESNQEKLAELEQIGETGAQYKKIESNIKNLKSKITRLNDKIQSASQPLQIKAKQTPRSRAGFTLFENGQPVGTYPTQEDAQIAAVQFRTDEELDGIINAAPRTAMEGALEQPFGEQPVQRGTVRSGMARRLYDEAVKEKDRRYRSQAGLPPPTAPVKIKITGDAQAAAERLRASGITVRFMPEVQKEIPEINKRLRAVLDKLGLKDIRLNVVDSLKAPGYVIYGRDGKPAAMFLKVPPGSPEYAKTMATIAQARAQGLRVEEDVFSANGSYAAKLIEIALDSKNPIRAARHEAIHALKELGFFTPQQWAVLERKAKSEWLKKYNIEGSGYGSLSKESQIEEAIADAFSDFDQEKPPTGLIGILFNKVKKFFEALGNAFRGSGFQTASDVFTLVEEGRLTGPMAPEVQGGLKKFSIGRSSDPAINIITGETAKPNFGKKTTVEDVGNYFDGLIREEFGGPLDFRNPQHFDRAVEIALQELQYQRELENSGFDWYDKDIADAFEITAEVLPQLSNPVKRNLFNLIAGIMSPGVNARDNWVIAAKAFRHYVNTGTIPGLNPANNRLWQGGVQSATKRDQLNMLNAMVQDMGELGAVEWAYGSHPVSEINDFRSRYGGFTSKVSGKATSEKTGIDAFGPKVGPFIANINGIHAETVDRWMIRTFNRYFGTMVDANGNMLDAPTGEPQRRAAQELLRRVGDELGVRPYQAQSMLWFFEQSLFRAMGTPAPSYGFSDGARRYRDDAREGRGDEEGRGDGAPTDQGRPDTRFSLRSDELAGRPGAPGGTAERTGDRRGRDQGRSNTPLEGAPVVQGATGPDANLVSVAERYAQENEIPYRRQGEYVDVDPQFGGRVARAYDAMIHDPQSPAVKEAYADLIRQTRAQYDALIDSGYRFTFYDSNTDPYDGNPFNAMRDLRANKRMAVYGTYDGYGTEGITGAAIADNPMLEDTGLRWPDQAGNPQVVTANDLFRAVHDAFGHGLEGAGFRARGEENAFQAHARLFTGPALGALASETRGQNSWLNFGPYGEQNANAKVLDTVFAEQKTGLMPNWTWTTNMALDMVEPEVFPDIGEGISIRPQQPGAQSFDAVHYGKTKTNVLGGSFYGTGLKGAEAERLSYSTDPRIKRRAYFYISRPNGQMPKPEVGVGNQVHIQRLNNMLGPGAEMSALARASVVDGRFNENVFESSVIDAGYDGYALPADGMAVVLDANVPVIPRGTRQEVEAKPEKDKIQIGDRKYSLRQTNTKEFKNWFGDSKVVDKKGNPLIVYHGTAYDFSEFSKDKLGSNTGAPSARVGFFFTARPKTADYYARGTFPNLETAAKARSRVIYNTPTGQWEEGAELVFTTEGTTPNIMPVYLSLQNPLVYDFKNQVFRDKKYRELIDQAKAEGHDGVILRNTYDSGEYSRMDAIMQGRFKGEDIYVVFEPTQVKSAIGNIGTFDPKNPDVRYSLRQTGTKEFKDWFGESKIVNADSTPKVMYHGTARDIGTFKPKQAGAIFLTDDPNFANSFAGLSEGYMIDELYASLSNQERIDIQNQARKIAKKEGTSPADELTVVLRDRLLSRANIMPLYVRAERPFDFENTRDTDRLFVKTNLGRNLKADQIKNLLAGSWETIESPAVQKAIKEAGFDSFYVYEGGEKNLAVYDPNQVKSAIGNFGTFSRDNNDIRYSIALGSLEPRTALIPDLGGNPDGTLGNTPDKFGSKPIRMTVGTHNDITDKGYGANHVLNRVLNDSDRMADLDMSVKEVLERILVTAQKTAQNYSRIYRDPKTNNLAFYTPKNTMFLSEDKDQFSIVTMFKVDRPDQTFGQPLWQGRAPVVPQFVGKIKGTEVVEREGRVQTKAEIKVSTKPKRVYTPSDIAAIAAEEPTKGTISLEKKLSLRQQIIDGADAIAQMPKDVKDNTEYVNMPGGYQSHNLYEARKLAPKPTNKLKKVTENNSETLNMETDYVLNVDGEHYYINLEEDPDDEDAFVYSFSPATDPNQYTTTVTFDVDDLIKEIRDSASKAPRTQYSLAGTANVQAFGLTPTDSKDNMIFLLQDKNIDLKRVIQAIQKSGKDLADRWDAYLKEELFHGRSATRIKFFIDRELRPLLQKMDAANVSLEQMDDYLLARHAKEANAYIRKINPDPNQNSGMTDKEADDYMASLPALRKQVLERFAKEIDGMTKETRKLMVDYGLEDQNTINQWEKTYKNYVPLFREEIEDGLPISIGRGYQIRGSTTRQRMGSSRKVVDVLANIALQRERTIVRGEKSRVGNALYGLILDNPNKGFWGVINPEKMSKQALRMELLNMGINPNKVDEMVARPPKKTINKTTGLVGYEIPSMWKEAKNIFATRVNGQDQFMIFNDKDERAMRMVATLQSLDAQQQGEAIKMMGTAGDYYRKSIGGIGTVTRYFAQINTQYNPAFGIYNLMRDIGGAVLNLQTTPLKGQEAKVISDALIALKSVYRDLRRQRNGLDADSPWAKIFEEFELEGGKTGYRDLFETTESRAEALQKELDNFSKGKLKGSGKAVMGWLSDFNDAIENSVRVSVYKNAIDKGISKERAASLAKNITVNFNRSGAVSRNFQTLFAFFNASIQGTARIAQTLLTSEGKLSPTGKKIVMGGITLGIIQAALLAMAGLDDDDVPDFVKDKSFVIPYGDGKYFAIPMPLGYNIIPGFGRRVMEFAMSDDKNVGKAVVDTSTMILDGFNPLGSATFVQTLTPTVLDPIVALAENKDFTGKPISREDINSLSPTPGYTRGSQNSFAITEALAYGINILTGGTEFKRGALSPTPDQIEYLVGEAFGGVGREALKIGRGIESIATGEELATYNVPIVGRLTGNIQQQAAQRSKFFNNVRRLNEHQAEIEGRLLKGEEINEYLNDFPEASMYQVGDKIYNRITKLRQMKKALEGAGAGKEELKAVDEAMLGLMVSLNQIYDSAKQQ